MRSHYALAGTIRYYKIAADVELLPGRPSPRLRVKLGAAQAGAAFDFSRWKDAPHVALANLRDEPEAVLRFTRTYGLLARDKRKTVLIREVLDYRDFLRRAWEGDTYNFFALPATGISLCAQSAGGFQIAISALWPLIQVMFIQDWPEKRVKKCANPDCHEVPYFYAVRRGQRFCSQKCAVLINVRHFREREAARAQSERGKHAKAKKA